MGLPGSPSTAEVAGAIGFDDFDNFSWSLVRQDIKEPHTVAMFVCEARCFASEARSPARRSQFVLYLIRTISGVFRMSVTRMHVSQIQTTVRHFVGCASTFITGHNNGGTSDCCLVTHFLFMHSCNTCFFNSKYTVHDLITCGLL
jgi:hypothetical protein